MADNTQETVLVYRVDDAALNKAESKIKGLAKDNDALAKSLDKVDDVSANVSKEFERLKRSADIDKVVKSALALEKKTKDSDAAVKQLTADLQKMGATAQESQGAASQFAGAGRGFDLGQFGRNLKSAPAVPIGIGGLTTEPISKALIGLDSLGVSIGELGVIAPLAVIAIGAIALAFAKFNEDAKKQAESLNAVIEARRDVGQDVARGLTTSEADTQTEELNRLREKEAQTLATLKAQYDEQITAQNDLFETALRLTPQEEALEQQIKKSEAAIAGYNTTESQLQLARENGELAANDAAQAERDLAAERTKSVLGDAQRAGELEAARQQTNEKSKEELTALIEAEANRTAQLQAELAVLQASGDGSKEVTDKIAGLQNQLDLSAQKSDIFKNAMGSAQTQTQKSAAAQIESAKASKLVAQEVSRMTTGLSSASSGLRQLGENIFAITREASKPTGILGIGKRPAAAIEQDRKKAQELEKAAQDYQKQLTDINRELITSFNDIGLGLQDSLQDLNINTRRDIRDALSEGAFLSIRDIQRSASDERADLEREAARDRRDAQMKANQELLDLQAQFLQAQIGQMQNAINSIRGGKTGATQGSFVLSAPR